MAVYVIFFFVEKKRQSFIIMNLQVFDLSKKSY
jgi:hypothetical protein